MAPLALQQADVESIKKISTAAPALMHALWRRSNPPRGCAGCHILVTIARMEGTPPASPPGGSWSIDSSSCTIAMRYGCQDTQGVTEAKPTARRSWTWHGLTEQELTGA